MTENGAVRVHRLVEGPDDAPVAVLVNSLGTTLEMWDPQAAALRERFRLIRYDARGHGRSPVPPGPYAVADLGADLLALLDDLGVRRAHLCGLSLGGLTSLWVAAHAADRVESLAVLSAPARFANADRYVERAAAVRAEGTAPIADGVVGRWLTAEYAAARPDVAAWLRAMVASTPAEGYAASAEAVAAADLSSELGSIHARSLCIVAAQDPAVEIADVEALARGLPNAQFVTVERAAHLLNVERPFEVLQLLTGHLGAGVA